MPFVSVDKSCCPNACSKRSWNAWKAELAPCVFGIDDDTGVVTESFACTGYIRGKKRECFVVF